MKSLTTLLLAALLSFAVVALPGCTLLGEPIAEKVADAIDKYCEEPQGARRLYRETINMQLAGEGHSIAVTCQGDEPEAGPTTWLQFEPYDGGYLVAEIDAEPG